MRKITPYQIADILTKSLKGEPLLTGEQKLLDDWLADKSDNRKLLEELKDTEKFEQHLSESNQINVASAFSKVYQRSSRSIVNKRVMRWTSYAAAVLLPILAIWGILHWNGNESVNMLTKSEQTVILPGGSKAVLYLANGREIDLEQAGNKEIKEGDGTLIETSGRQIKYNRAETNFSEKEQVLTNTIYIPRKGEFKLTLSDGTTVWLNSETKLEYPTHFAVNAREVTLTGEAFFEVVKDPDRPFVVKAGEAAVKVLGTSFNVKAYADEEAITTTLVTGKVMLSSQQQERTKEVVLHPGMQGVVSGQKNIEVNKVDPLVYSAWKDGEFRFENRTLESIMKTLQRWYDVRVVFENETVKDKRFSGDLERYTEIKTHLDMIGMTTNVQFKIKDGVVYVK